MKPQSKPVHQEVRIGHVHLKVADLDWALAFYRDVLGFVVLFVALVLLVVSFVARSVAG
jgi:catechol-2,3-dioxygenase